MPYKHIAAHLKKTELACRLHYHQLSRGSHRRRRRASTSTTSSTSSTSSKYSFSQLPLPGHFDPGMAYNQNCGYSTYAPQPYASLNASPDRPHHKLLLPKPPTITPDSSPDRLSGLKIDTNFNNGICVWAERLFGLSPGVRGLLMALELVFHISSNCDGDISLPNSAAIADQNEPR